jgi:hypothetical protein
VNGEDVASRMWLELSALAPDRWPAIRRAVAARIAAGLLAELDLERQRRARQLAHREVA